MAKRDKIILEVEVPQAWVEKFEAMVKQTGRSLSELIQEALAQYIGIEQNNTTAGLEAFESELTHLKQKVTELEAYKDQVKTLATRLEITERIVAQVQSQIISAGVISSPKSLSIKIEEDDEIEDEPDEILADFLPR